MLKRIALFVIIITIASFVLSDPASAQDKHKQKGIEFLQNKKYQKAVDELKKAISKNPDDAEAYYYIGVAYRKLGKKQLRNAATGMKHALRIKSDNPEWHYELAQTYDDMDKYEVSLPSSKRSSYDLAIEAYKKTIQLKSDFLEAHLSLGLLYHRKGKYELAAEKFCEVIRLNLNNVTAYLCLADCYFKHDRFDEAIENLNNAIRLEPLNPNPYLLKANIYWYQGNYEAAKKEYNEVLQLDTQNKIAKARLDSITIIIENETKINKLLEKGENFLQAKQYENAIEQFEEVTKINPHHPDANKKLTDAKTSLSDYWYERGCERLDYRRLENAVSNFNRALEYAVTREQIDKIITKWQEVQKTLGKEAQLYKIYRKGKSLIIRGEFSTAIEYLSVASQEYDAIRADARSALDTLRAADAYHFAKDKESGGDLMSALVFYKEIFKVDSTYKDIRYKIEKINGELAFTKGEWRQAIGYFKQAEILNPKDPQISFKIEQAQINLNEKEKTERNKSIQLVLFGFIFGAFIASISIVFRKFLLKILTNILETFLKYKIIIVLFILLILISILVFKCWDKIEPVFYLESTTSVIIMAIVTFMILLAIVVFITIKLENVNFEQGFQIVGTIFFLILFLTLFSIQKKSIVGFNIAAGSTSFIIPQQNDDVDKVKIINEEINSNLIEIKNFKQIKFKVKYLKKGRRLINLCKDCEIIIKPKDEDNDNNLRFIKANKDNLKLQFLEIPVESQVSIKKARENIVFGIKKEKAFLTEYHSYLKLNANNRIIFNFTNCLISIKNRIIYDNSEIYSIELNRKSIVKISDFSPKELKIEIEPNLLEGEEFHRICQLEKVYDISCLEGVKQTSLTSTIKEGTVKIGKNERLLKKWDSFIATPKLFTKLTIQTSPENLFLRFFGKLESLKIGEQEFLETQPEEIPNLATWLSDNRLSIIFLAILAWMTFLSAIRESKFLENIKKTFGL